jgi:hypothetical protein
MGWLGWTLTIMGLLAGSISVLTLVGVVFIPTKHVLSRSVTIPRSAFDVYGAIRDGQSWPTWWDILDRVEVTTPSGQPEAWRFVYKDGNAFRLVLEADAPPARLVQRIEDESAIFGGTWTFDLKSDGDSTIVTLTEHGEIYHPLIRAIAKVSMNPAMYVEGNLTGLAKHFGIAQPKVTIVTVESTK